VLEAVKSMGGRAIVTSDHGNADCMLEPDGTSPFTAHTTNPVPFILVGRRVAGDNGARSAQDEGIKLRNNGKLCDICPTVLDLLGLEKPEEMSGQSLII